MGIQDSSTGSSPSAAILTCPADFVFYQCLLLNRTIYIYYQGTSHQNPLGPRPTVLRKEILKRKPKNNYTSQRGEKCF